MKTLRSFCYVCCLFLAPGVSQQTAAATLNQTVQFVGQSPERLYRAFLSSTEHMAMTLDGAQPTTFYRPGVGPVETAAAGDELRAFAMKGPAGETIYRLTARVLALEPNRSIVMSWKNLAWKAAVNPADVTDQDSTVTLTFRSNAAGAEIQLVQANVPDYAVRLPDTGEVGPLSQIVNTHWSLIYWEPMKRHFQTAEAGKVVSDFYHAVVNRDLATARTYLADNLEFVGLFETYPNAESYLKALTGLLGITTKLDVKTIISNGDQAAVFFELTTKAPAEAMTLVAEWFEVRNGKIVHVRSAFDGRPFAVMFAKPAK